MAEEDRETAYKVNVEGTQNIAKACKKLDIPMLYISTDYVFDGTKKGKYLPDDKTNPINYFVPVIKRHILLFVDLVLFFYLFRSIIPHTFDNYIEFFAYTAVVITISSAIIISEFYLFSQGVRDFIKRTTSLVCHW